MTQPIKKKYVGNNQIDGEKILLSQGQKLLGLDSQNQESELIGFDENDNVLIGGELVATSESLTAEQAARIAADEALSERIDNVLSNLDPAIIDSFSEVVTELQTQQANLVSVDQALQASISAEQQRATAAEQLITQNLNTEIASREAADVILQNNINIETAARITGDTTLQSNLDTEALTRATADTNLDQKIETEKSRIDAILLASDADKNSFAEIVSLINSVDLENDTAFASYVLSNDLRSSQIETNLSNEIATRQLVDTTLETSINNEVARATLAEQNLQSAINAEQGARELADTNLQSIINTVDSFAQQTRQDLDQEVLDRESGDEALDTAINAEVTARQAAVLAEEQARVSADTNLQTQINAEEAARVAGDSSTLAESKLYTDSKVSLVLSNLDTAALDSLVEVVDAFEAADENLNNAITNLAASATTNLNAEIAAREAADLVLQSNINAENTRALAAEANLQSEIDAEETARANKDTEIENNLASETAARIASDNSLATAISNEETRAVNVESNLQSQITQEISDRGAAVSSVQSNLDAEVARALNAESTLQLAINSEESSRIAEDLTFLKLSGQRAMEGNLNMGSRGPLEFAGSASTVTSSPDEQAVIEIGQSFTPGQSAVELHSNGVKLWATNSDGTYYFAPNHYLIVENLSFAYSNSRLSFLAHQAGSYSLSLYSPGEITNHKIINLANGSSANDAVNKSQLDSEQSRAEAVEASLQSQITQEVYERTIADGSLQSNIDAEAIRATAAEGSLQSQISQESSDRSLADAAFDSRLIIIEGPDFVEGSIAKAEKDAKDYADSLVANATQTLTESLAQEITTRQSEDNLLDARLDVLEADPVTKTYVDSGVSDLQNQISNVLSNVDGAALDSLTEIVEAFQAADQNLNGAITALSTGLSADLATETAARIAADQTLQQNIDAEVVRATAAETALETSLGELATEVNQQFTDLDNAISTETFRAQQVEQSLQSQITQEIADRIAGDQSLDARLDVLELDPVTKLYVDTADNSLDTKITAEKLRVDSILEATNSDNNSLKKLFDLINLKDSENDQALGDYILVNNNAVFSLQNRATALESNVSAAQQDITNLQSDLELEAQGRQGADSVLQTNIDVLNVYAQDTRNDLDILSSDVTANKALFDQEVLDRTAGDVATLSSANAYTDTKVSAEALIRETTDTNLQSQITTEKERVDAILTASEADKNSFAEIVQLINSIDTSNDQAFASYVLLNDARVLAVEEDLAQEINDREAGDAATLTSAQDYSDNLHATQAAEIDALETSLANEVTAREALDISVNQKITAEETARIAADQTLQANITAENTRALAAEAALHSEVNALEVYAQDVRADLDQETLDRTSADTALQTSIDEVEANLAQELLDRAAGDTALSNQLTALEQTLVAVDTQLAADIADLETFTTTTKTELDAEIARATLAETNLSNAIATETTARQSAIATLTNTVSTIETQLSADIAAEVTARQQADTAIYAEINAKISQVLNNTDPAAIDSFTEVVAAFEAADENLNNAITALGTNASSALAAEITRATAAENNLQSQIDAEVLRATGAEATLTTNLANEVTARVTADANLQSQIDSIMSNINPDLLDSFTEVVEAFQAADSNLNNAISNLGASASSALLSEVNRAIAAETNLQNQITAEVTRATAAETTIADNLTAEISARELADTAEQTARIAGDQNLQTQINNILSNIDPAAIDSFTEVVTAFQTADSNINNAITNLANSASASLAAEVSRAQAAEANLQSQINSIESDALANVGALDARLDVLEADPVTKAYVDSSASGIQSQLNFITSNTNPTALDSLTEIVSAFQTMDSNLQNSISVLAFGTSMQFTQEQTTRLAADNNLQAQINSLTSAQTGGSAFLQTQINTEKARIDAILSASEADKDSFAEIVTLINSVDTANDQAFAGYVLSNNARVLAEEQARQALENEFDAYVVSNNAALAQEVLDRQLADNQLSSRVSVLELDSVTKTYVDNKDAENLAALSVESSARQAADTLLQQNINTEKARIDAILSASEADKDSFAEIVQLINSVDTANDSAFASYVLSNDSAVAGLDSRLDVVEPKVAALESGLAQEITDRQAADSAIQTSLTSEITRATNAEATLQQNIDAVDTLADELRVDLDDLEAFALDTRNDLDDLEAFALDTRNDLDALQVQVNSVEAATNANTASITSVSNRVGVLEAKPYYDFHSLQIPVTSVAQQQYVDCDHEANIHSLDIHVEAMKAHRLRDFTTSIVDGKTRITWVNTFAIGGVEELEMNEVIYISYSYRV